MRMQGVCISVQYPRGRIILDPPRVYSSKTVHGDERHVIPSLLLETRSNIQADEWLIKSEAVNLIQQRVHLIQLVVILVILAAAEERVDEDRPVRRRSRRAEPNLELVHPRPRLIVPRRVTTQGRVTAVVVFVRCNNSANFNDVSRVRTDYSARGTHGAHTYLR